MSRKSSKVAVGGFVLGSIAFLIICIMTLGGKNFFSDDIEYVLYFEGSVNGLSLGAPVVFRGVPLGTVTQILLVANPRDEEITIPVHVTINASSIAFDSVGERVSESARSMLMQRMIQRGLRARLHMRSLVTGQYDVELDFFPETPARYHSTDHAREIPTIPSTFDEFERTLTSLPLEDMSRSLNAALDGFASLSTSEDLHKSIAALRKTLENTAELTSGATSLRDDLQRAVNALGDTSVTLDNQLPEAMAAFQLAMGSFAAVANELEQTIISANKIVSPNSKTLQEVHNALGEFSRTARSFRELARLLEKQPEALLLGKGSK